MVDTEILWRFFILWLVTVPTPGANSLMVTHLSLTRPAIHVGFALIGHIVAVLMLAVCALLGWAALLELFPWLRTIVGVLGGVYLIYCGWLLSRRACSVSTAPFSTHSNADTDNDRTEPSKAFVVGFATALSNAQAILFITSIFAVTGVLTANPPTAVSVLGIIIVCNLSYLGFLGWIFRRPTIRAGYQRFRRWIEGVVGALFVVFGVRLIIREVWR
jgi:threonine efflux protein